MTKRYLITIHNDAFCGTWQFMFHGTISWWQGFCLTMAGWEIQEIK